MSSEEEANFLANYLGDLEEKTWRMTWVNLLQVVGHRPSYGRGTKCVFLGFCCVDATQVMGVMGWGGGDGNVP